MCVRMMRIPVLGLLLLLLSGGARALPQASFLPSSLSSSPPPSALLLAPQAFAPLPVGSITPKGWLLEQLKLQAEGLSGHLAMFYPSIADSWWVGGAQDQGGMIYQQAPYWLNGFLPLAYQLKNAGIEVLHLKCGPSKPHDHSQHRREHSGEDEDRDGATTLGLPTGPVNPLAQVKAYIDGIMRRVQPDGWVGPTPAGGGGTTGTPTSTCEAGLNLYGGDLAKRQGGGGAGGLPGGNVSACEEKCRSTSACAAYVFEGCGTTNTCWLKAGSWKEQKGHKLPPSCSLCSQKVRALPLPTHGNGDQYWGPT